jgi:hypothetical protein
MVPQATFMGMSKELIMKYTKLAVLCALMSPVIIEASLLDDYTNHSFMFVRPVYDTVGIQQSSWHDIVYRKQKNGFGCQIYPIYEQSYPNLNNPAYFFFSGLNVLRVQAGSESSFKTTGSTPAVSPPIVNNPTDGQICVPSFNRDVLGQWIGITPDITTASMDFTICPQERQACLVFEVSQDLHKFINHTLFENWFINLSVPVTWLETNLNPQGTNSVVVNAFNNPNFNFVRMTPGEMTNARITQFSLSLGTRYMADDDTHVISTTGVIVPLVEQDCSRSLFQPVQGFNAHFGFDTNVFFQFPICQKHEYSKSKILFFLDVHNNFLARNHQLRTFDIRNNPFSRYMLFLDRATNTTIPAMNALTIRARVEPFMITNMATGFRFKHHDSFGEIGYELWAHGAERVTPEPKSEYHVDPCNTWYDDRYGFAFINMQGQLAKVNMTSGAVEALAPGELGQTASQSTINYVAAPDGQASCCPTPTFTQKNVYFRLIDLDHISAGCASSITHRGYASITFGTKGTKRDCFANFGLFIEAAQNNAALCFWGGWFKMGLTF